MPQINENDVMVVEDGSAIQYFVTSCLTVTCGFSDDSMVGGHFSHGQGGTYGDSVAAWQIFTDAVGTKVSANGGATWVKAIGQIDMWQPAYLTTQPLSADTAMAGDLSDTISFFTGRTPEILATNGSIVVTPDGTVV